ncbi:MAG: hypothetical protein ACTJLL_01195, partial [Anaplasma sp.]
MKVTMATINGDIRDIRLCWAMKPLYPVTCCDQRESSKISPTISHQQARSWGKGEQAGVERISISPLWRIVTTTLGKPVT